MNTKFLLILLSICFTSNFALASKKDMRALANEADDYVSESREYANGVKLVKLKVTPELKKPLVKFLINKENEVQKMFIKFARNNPNELHGEPGLAIKDPISYFEVKYLFEIETVYKVYKKGKFIGYVFDCINHADSEIIQDGSWTIIYTDKNMKVITTRDGTA